MFHSYKINSVKISSFDFLMEIVSRFPHLKDNNLFFKHGATKEIRTICHDDMEYKNEIWWFGDNIFYSNHNVPLFVKDRGSFLEQGQCFWEIRDGQLPHHQLRFHIEPEYIMGTFDSDFHEGLEFKVLVRTSSMCIDGTLYAHDVKNNVIEEIKDSQNEDFYPTYWIVDQYGQTHYKTLDQLRLLG